MQRFAPPHLRFATISIYNPSLRVFLVSRSFPRPDKDRFVYCRFRLFVRYSQGDLFLIMNVDAQLSPRMSTRKLAIDLAYRLSSLQNFLEGSEELCRYNEQLTDADIQRHGRRVGCRSITCRSHVF